MEHQTDHRGGLHHAANKANNNKVILAIAAAVIVILIGAVVAWALKSGGDNTASAIDGSKYQAVFFTNGQVYFGKLETFNSDYFKMKDIYYLQANQQDQAAEDKQNPQETNTDQNANVQLIKLGNEIHGPQDEMIVARDQILFFENLKTDGKVAKSIEQFKNQN